MPEVVDEPIHRNHVAARDEQQGEHGPLAGAAEVDRPRFVLRLERPEYSNPHHRAKRMH